jgi:hypothetical protein
MKIEILDPEEQPTEKVNVNSIERSAIKLKTSARKCTSK